MQSKHTHTHTHTHTDMLKCKQIIILNKKKLHGKDKSWQMIGQFQSLSCFCVDKHKNTIAGHHHTWDLNPNFFFKILFIYWTERHSERGNTNRGSVRGRSRLPAEQGARCGARSLDPGIMTQVEGRHLTTEPPRCPGTQIIFKGEGEPEITVI